MGIENKNKRNTILVLLNAPGQASALPVLAKPSSEPTLSLLGLRRSCLLNRVARNRFPRYTTRRILLRDGWRGVAIVWRPAYLIVAAVVVASAAAQAAHAGILYTDRKAWRLVKGALAETNAVVIHRLRLPSWDRRLCAFDRAVVTAGGIGLIARGFRRGAAP